jgi:hypothetical protein
LLCLWAIVRFPLWPVGINLNRSGLASLLSQPRIPAMRFIERHLCRSPYAGARRVTVSSRSSRSAPQTETDQARKGPLARERRPRHNRAFGGAMKPQHLALKVSKVSRDLAIRPDRRYICCRSAFGPCKKSALPRRRLRFSRPRAAAFHSRHKIAPLATHGRFLLCYPQGYAQFFEPRG